MSIAVRLVRAHLELLRVLWLAALRRAAADGFSYHRGSSDLAFAVAIIPGTLAEIVALHLLLPASWDGPKIVIVVMSVYATVCMVAGALARRVLPHRVTPSALELNLGMAAKTSIGLDLIERLAIQRRRTTRPSGLLQDGDDTLLAERNRVDLMLTLARPVAVERLLRGPVCTEHIGVAVDDPHRLVRALVERGVPQTPLADEPGLNGSASRGRSRSRR